MKNRFFYLLFIGITFFGANSSIGGDKYAKVSVREAVVAGQFYPADASKLKAALQNYFEDARSASGNKPLAIISPHAGYIYSGQIAADAYNQARDYSYDLIVLLGTNHTTPGFYGISVYPRKGYKTPLGVVEIDREIADALIESGKEYSYYAPVHQKEHSVEVQVPFVQYVFPGVKIVPVIIGKPDPELCVNFGKALAKLTKERQVLIVASSDLSHYPTDENAAKVDQQTLEAIVKLNPIHLHSIIQAQMNRNVTNLVTCACGEAPILAAIAAAKELGANCGKIISYTNSGRTLIGYRERVVGYGAVAFSIDENCIQPQTSIETPGVQRELYELTHTHKKMLLEFARKSITTFLNSETAPLPRDFDPALQRKQGAFVTLRKKGELRGCIGHMGEDKPLFDVVGSMALQAAFNDPRFNPVAKDELPEIDIEISVLTPYKQINSVEEIVTGRDGVLLKKEGKQAVFLPQVAAERRWDRYQLLNHLCIKAGLKPDSWGKDARLFTFQAIIFEESEFKLFQ
jgi:AmmeMemoRadiSam system protein B/AmmeMemoRadiSam system protein A